jgi:hypothetical protein
MRRGTARTAALAGVFGLLALSWLGASQARAQTSPARLACELYEDLINEAVDFCGEEGCAPTQRECDKLCGNVTRTCTSIARVRGKTTDDAIKGEARQDRILCKTADDPKQCKSTVKSVEKDAKTASKDFRKDTENNCESDALVLQCVSACNLGLSCSCVGGIAMECD